MKKKRLRTEVCMDKMALTALCVGIADLLFLDPMKSRLGAFIFLVCAIIFLTREVLPSIRDWSRREDGAERVLRTQKMVGRSTASPLGTVIDWPTQDEERLRKRALIGARARRHPPVQ